MARQQLDLKKQGETIYSFGEPQITEDNEKQTTPGNVQKWWNYFFSLE